MQLCLEVWKVGEGGGVRKICDTAEGGDDTANSACPLYALGHTLPRAKARTPNTMDITQGRKPHARTRCMAKTTE